MPKSSNISLAEGIRIFQEESKRAGRLLAKKQAAEKAEFIKNNPNASAKYSTINFSNPVERAKFDYGIGGGDVQSLN